MDNPSLLHVIFGMQAAQLVLIFLLNRKIDGLRSEMHELFAGAGITLANLKERTAHLPT